MIFLGQKACLLASLCRKTNDYTDSSNPKRRRKRICLCLQSGQSEKTPIETETNLGRKVVKSGLNWKDQVIANPNKELKDNQDVQVAAND